MFLPGLSPRNRKPLLNRDTKSLDCQEVGCCYTKPPSGRSATTLGNVICVSAPCAKDRLQNTLVDSTTSLSLPGSVCDDIDCNSMSSDTNLQSIDCEKRISNSNRQNRHNSNHESLEKRLANARNRSSAVYTIESDDRSQARRQYHAIPKESSGKKKKPFAKQDSKPEMATMDAMTPPKVIVADPQPECRGANVTKRLQKKYFIEDREIHRFFVENLCQKELTLNCFAKLVTGLILVAVIILFVVTLYRFLS